MNSSTRQAQNPDPFCCDLSLEAEEVIFGTAPTVKTWFLLEYAGPWHHKATQQNDLPPVVQGWLNDRLAQTPDSRLLFIKQKRPAGATGISFFVARCHETTPRLYRFSLADYHSLLELDLAKILGDRTAGDPGLPPTLSEEPIVLVCTNGKRDRCCAREGPAVYQAITAYAGDNAWQCTHVGGHRFSPALVTLPDGAVYGRLTPAEAGPFVRSYRQGELFLEKLRGRTIYDPLIQAAEHFLRRETGLRRQDAYRWQETAALADDRWAVTFRGPAGESPRIVVIQDAAVERVVSCRPLKRKSVASFRIGINPDLPG